jgi:hypothetical protein
VIGLHSGDRRLPYHKGTREVLCEAGIGIGNQEVNERCQGVRARVFLLDDFVDGAAAGFLLRVEFPGRPDRRHRLAVVVEVVGQEVAARLDEQAIRSLQQHP